MIDLTEENKILHLRMDILKKEFSELFSIRNEMLSHEEETLTALYLNAIGGKIFQNYCLTVEIAMLKQRIMLTQSYLNRNEIPNLAAIDTKIKKEFADYQKKIEDEAKRLTAAKDYLKSGFLSAEETKKLKDAYRLIVKKLHPDINPNVTEFEKDLLVKAQAAYDLCDLITLNEILLSLDLNKDGASNIKPIDLKEFVTKMDVSVNKLKEQIENLETQFPFTFRDKLANPEWIKTKQQSLDAEISELTKEIKKHTEYLLILQIWKPGLLN